MADRNRRKHDPLPRVPGRAVAHASAFSAIGIDVEPNVPLPFGLLDAISSRREQADLRDLVGDHPQAAWDRALFSAKESTYKAWYAQTGSWLGFDDARVRFTDDGQAFDVEIRHATLRSGAIAYRGAVAVSAAHLVTAVAVER